MPFEHQSDPWTESLFAKSEDSKKVVGFDGPFTLPVEQRLLTEAAEHGHRRALVQVMMHLNLRGKDARALVFSLLETACRDMTVDEVEAEFNSRMSHSQG